MLSFLESSSNFELVWTSFSIENQVIDRNRFPYCHPDLNESSGDFWKHVLRRFTTLNQFIIIMLNMYVVKLVLWSCFNWFVSYFRTSPIGYQIIGLYRRAWWFLCCLYWPEFRSCLVFEENWFRAFNLNRFELVWCFMCFTDFDHFKYAPWISISLDWLILIELVHSFEFGDL